MNVAIIIYPGFDELDAIAPFEVLQNAASLGAEFQTRLVTIDQIDEIVASHGLRVRPNAQLSADERPDILIVPGGGWNSRAPQSAWAEAERGAIPALIKRLYNSGTTIAAVCTSGMLAAAAGIIGDRPAITHHSAVDDLRAMGATVVQARVVDDDQIIKAGGVTSGLDLALWLVERFASPQIALAVEERMEYERRGTVWRRSTGADH